jgi:hypothetical protein
MLEERGLPTTVIALVLPQVVKTRPPRALMVPFMLGRPLGEPNDSGFQQRVLLQALGLLARNDGPVILEHFSEDNPSWFDRPGWRSSVVLTKYPVPPSPEGWERIFQDELNLVLPAWGRFKSRFARTTVGLADLAVADWSGFVCAFLMGQLPIIPALDTPALSLRFLVDDIKALYGEAAQADGPPPSARQIDAWFWRETMAGELLLALRAMALESSNNALRTVGGRFFAPAPYVPRVDAIAKM